MLEGNWASIEDFATLFQYFWYRDFPMDQSHRGALRSDWTIHIGDVVRNVANLMGLYARFEPGRKDGVIRNTKQDVIALEWEWRGVWENELKKLKEHKVFFFGDNPSEKEPLKYCVFITYTHTPNIGKVYEHVLKHWEDAPCPLLLILINFEDSKEFASGREFKKMQISVFHKGERRELRSAPAFPWEVSGTRWFYELK